MADHISLTMYTQTNYEIQNQNAERVRACRSLNFHFTVLLTQKKNFLGWSVLKMDPKVFIATWLMSAIFTGPVSLEGKTICSVRLSVRLFLLYLLN